MSFKLFYMWLAQHIFSRCLDNGISPSIVPVAIKMSQGMCFPLAPLYLGNLYKRLDLYHLKTEILDKILTYVDMFFFQICLWERFNACAPPPSPGPSTTSFSKFSGNNYRAWFCHNHNSKGNILQVLDIVKEFTWCPYIKGKNV